QAIGTDEGKKLQAQNDQQGIWIVSVMALFFGLIFSFNLVFLLFALFFFTVTSLSVGSVLPIMLFAFGAGITTFIGFHYFDPKFRETFFETPKGNGGFGGSSGGGGFSGGGGSSGGGGAGD
ncbi:TPA: hypothetical protein DCZ36_03865, partial [Candidatus Gracilibacteria bacterium]|nr:hypothetical protein [Candidatus Gracilibacteria bacterium]